MASLPFVMLECNGTTECPRLYGGLGEVENGRANVAVQLAGCVMMYQSVCADQLESLAALLLSTARELRGDTPTAGESDDVVDALPADGTVVKLRNDSGVRGRVYTYSTGPTVVRDARGVETPWDAELWTPVS